MLLGLDDPAKLPTRRVHEVKEGHVATDILSIEQISDSSVTFLIGHWAAFHIIWIHRMLAFRFVYELSMLDSNNDKSSREIILAHQPSRGKGGLDSISAANVLLNTPLAYSDSTEGFW